MSKAPPSSTLNPMSPDLEVESVVEEFPQQQPSTLRRILSVALGVFAVGLLIIGISLQFAQPETVIRNNQPSVGEFAPRNRFSKPKTTFVHLFEWKWTDIEKECVNFLGPKGFAAVQVSPPNEHVNHKSIGRNPWWARYQPITYQLESRSGTREEFISMVNTCKAVGVDIYVDAVLNHMGETQTGVGNAGTPFNSETRDYEKFSSFDFNYCNPADIQGSDYSSDAYRVRHCELVSLPDLKQSSDYVRSVQAAFLQDMVDIGVAGFRLDAAKHMVVSEVNDILSRVNGDFYVFGEVIDYGGEAVSAFEYTPFYDVTEFRYEVTLVDRFTYGRLADLYGIGESFGFMSGLNAVVFVDNHDTQRYPNAPLIYRAGAVYNMANVFMLAWPYGYPKIMSSYAFNNNDFDAGPPSVNGGDTKNIYNGDGSINCFGEWICEHRWREIYQAVDFKNYVASVEAYNVEHWWTNNFQAIAFARTGSSGTAGFVVLNKENFAITQSWYTGLPDGRYCDVFNAGFDLETRQCDGNTVVVSGGNVYTTVNAYSALVIYGGARV